MVHSAKEADRQKASAWNGNQPLSKSEKFTKTAKTKDYLYHLLTLYISSRKKDILKKAKKGYLVIDMKMLCLL